MRRRGFIIFECLYTRGRRKPLSSPARTFRHHGIVVRCQFLQNWHESAIPTVAHRDRRIPPQASALGTSNGRATKLLPELFRTHFSEPLQRRVDQSFPRLKFHCAGSRSFAVPRTNIL